MGHYLILAGIPACGKTALARILEKRAGFKAFLEDHRTNPYHSDFAGDMSRWAFHNEVDFLISAAEAQAIINSTSGPACQDGSIYQCFHVFVQYLYDSNYLTERDYETLRRLYLMFDQLNRPPDLLVVLDASPSTCLSRVGERSRATDEKVGVNLPFLEDMHKRLEVWINSWSYSPILRIDTERLDFVHNSPAQRYVVQEICGHMKCT